MRRVVPKSGVLLRRAWMASLLFALLFPYSFVAAHPVPRRAHDRTITVKLAQDGKHLAVAVAYRLEVDEATVVLDDLPALGNKVDLRAASNDVDHVYRAFMDAYAPILAGNLIAKMDDETLDFKCTAKEHRLKDETGAALNHLRCDFVFQARTRLQADAGRHEFTFREGNYEFEEGLIRLSLAADSSIAIVSKTQPDAALQALPAAQLQPGDDARLRKLRVTFSAVAHDRSDAEIAAPSPGAVPPGQGWWSWLRDVSLRDLFRESKYGFWMLMLLSLAVGGVHAMTPGHGKTLVAAYLVGERGTIGHAFVLGLVTTLTHTGVVIAIAVALRLFVPGGRLTSAGQQQLQTVLELGGGFMVVCLGFWLLLRRLAGQADHFHLPGHGHHHHHGHDQGHEHTHADHYHDEHGQAHAIPGGVSWWGLVVLGINGGIVPCWDAIVVLLLAVSTNRLGLALPMLLAFSAGLAGTLILVGVVVVRAKHLAGARLQNSRASRMLPVASAVVVTLLGLWLCYDSLHAKPPAPADVVQRQAG